MRSVVESTLAPMTEQGWYQGTHIVFAMVAVEKRKTKLWHVYSKREMMDGEPGRGVLGYVKWFSRWRKYAFFPSQGCVFEEVCMREISDFIAGRTKRHKDGLARRKDRESVLT